MSRYELTKLKYLNDVELAALELTLAKYSLTNVRDVLLIELALRTGGRASEILNLTEESLFEEADGVGGVLIKGLKNSDDREIPLRPDLYARLKTFAKGRGSEPIFDIGLRQFERIWHQYRPVAKKLHSLRHTFAFNLYSKHRDLVLVQRALGHKSFENTLIYAQFHFKRDQMRKMIS